MARISILFLFLFTSCAKEFRNPYDPATPPDIWMPKSFKLDTLGTNALRLTWQQDELHIDGFAIHKTTNGQMKVILLPLDSLRYTDTQAVDTSSDVVCPELSYKVMARAGNNRSLEIGTASGIRMPLSTPTNAGADILVTDTATTVQLNAQAPNAGERGQWTIISGAGGSISNLNVHNSNFTGSPCTDYVLRWTKTGCSESFDEVNVKFQKALTISNAGANQIFTDGTTQTTLNANNSGAGESGVWTIISGAGGILENPSSPNTSFTGQSCTNYTLSWTITDVCNSSVDEMNVSFQKATTSANAGANQTITTNATQVALAANATAAGEIGTWTIVNGAGGGFSNVNSPTSIFTGNECSNYTLRWSIQGLCSSSYDDKTVSFSQSNTIAYAGVDQTITNNSTQVTLAANAPAIGEIGQWTILSGSNGSFSNSNSATSLFNGVLGQQYILSWGIATCNNSSSDSIFIAFPTISPGSGVTDIDGNNYSSQIIGFQEWMINNLKTNHYCNGDLIPNITVNSQWAGLTNGAWSYYDNFFSNSYVYGKLYNGFAVADPRNVCPCGWHLPTDAEWTTLTDYLGGLSVAGGKMKTTGTSLWGSPNLNATNESGFSGVPGGYNGGFFSQMNSGAYWWSVTEISSSQSWSRYIISGSSSVYRTAAQNYFGYSVRCVKDN
jgi:uncharacterized protein (TIGR02145 family)